VRTVHTDRAVLTVLASFLRVVFHNEAFTAGKFVFLLRDNDNIVLFIGHLRNAERVRVVLSINVRRGRSSLRDALFYRLE
jgi:hypothetical protein